MRKYADWIWIEGKFEKNEYVDFLYDFKLDNIDERATIKISADGEYVLWINGQFVNCGQYDDYPSQKVYDTLCIGSFLKAGKNTLAVTAYAPGEYTFSYSKGEKGMWFCIENFNNTFISSQDVMCRISKTYKCGIIHKTTSQLGYGYEYDANGEDLWLAYGHCRNHEWSNAIKKNIDTRLTPRPIKKCGIKELYTGMIIAQGLFIRENEEGKTSAQLMQSDFLSHRSFERLFAGEKGFPVKSIAEVDKGIYIVVDLQKERCGYFNFKLTAKKGTVIDIAFGEHMKDLRVRASIGERNFADRFICKEGEQDFTYYFKRIAGRYIELHVSNSENLKIDYVGIKEAFYPIEKEAKFISNDSLHNKIFKVCKDTLKLCMHEHYEDCPWREQALYTYDSRNQMLSGYYAFGEFEFAKASLELIIKSLKENGQLNICAPTDEKLTIPSFSMMWLLSVWEYTDYSKDLYFANKYWKEIEEMLACYALTMKDYLASPPRGNIYWNFYEWSEGYTGTEKDIKEMRENTDFYDCIYNLILYTAIRSVINMAKLSEKAGVAEEYVPLLLKMKESINKNFWDEEKKLYATFKTNGEIFHFGQLTQALVLYNKICDDKKSGFLCDALINNFEISQITLSYSIFKYEALIAYDKKNAKSVFDDIAEKWGCMLFNGATSFWETLKGSEDFQGAGSLCHGWSAIPLYMYLKYGAGFCLENENSFCGNAFAELYAESEFNGEAHFVECKGGIRNERNHFHK